MGVGDDEVQMHIFKYIFSFIYELIVNTKCIIKSDYVNIK